MKTYLPREGGILTLWFSGTAIGLAFPVEKGLLILAILYVAGSFLFLVSAETVEEFIRTRRGRGEARTHLLIPPVLGLIVWSPALHGDAYIVVALFIATLAFVSLRATERKEREWQTRAAFTGAVLLMALLGLLVSGARLSVLLVAAVFLIPFTFFSAQELFVQAVAEAQRRSGGESRPIFRNAPKSSRAVFFSFLGSYAVASAVIALLTPSAAFLVAFELFLVSFPAIWSSLGRRVSFRRLGLEQASLDVLMAAAIIAFAAMY